MSKVNFKTSLPKTVYTDIVGMPDPLLLGMTVHYYNHSDITLYMQMVGSSAGWSGGSVNLGSLVTGTDGYQNLDNFMSRAKPVSATTETINLTLNGYSDAGYTTLVYTFSRTVTVIFIKSDDGTWTQDFLDNFDDGTVDGWDHIIESGGWTGGAFLQHSFLVDTAYVLSSPYSLLFVMEADAGSSSYGRFTWYIWKTFTTPNRNTVYAVINLRYHPDFLNTTYPKWIEVYEDTTLLIHIGRIADNVETGYHPVDKWMRIVVPLTKNATITVKIRHDTFGYIHGAGEAEEHVWMDDFKIISK